MTEESKTLQPLPGLPNLDAPTKAPPTLQPGQFEIAQGEALNRLREENEVLTRERDNMAKALKELVNERDVLTVQVAELLEGDMTETIEDLTNTILRAFARETRTDGPSICSKLKIVLDNWWKTYHNDKS